MNWLFLVLAILLEVAGTTCMKLSQGLTKPGPSVLVFVFYGLSLSALTFALKRIDLGVAYAIWSGLGTALIALIGILWFREPVTALRLTSMGLVVLGVVGLNLAGGVR